MSFPGDAAEQWMAAGLREDPERFRPVLEAYRVLTSTEIQRVLAHELMVGDAVMVEIVASRFGYRETGRRIPLRSPGP